ncbi:glutamine--fructose-6-phosphate aminotransferase, partial [Patescibacteria group bacterium]|nr:glutamine--fructose-6-phosphate aminotransferase [Patescibacteria group bacterium]
MCGIFAYIGKKNNAAEIIFNGLKTLEYRGYDSWGIATQNHKKIIIEKHLGKLPEKLPESDFSNHKSGIGIGHTRWATHGGVTLLNTHPHFDCTQQISVLHNGIIENYQELKQELQAKNHVFKSETDTEVLA